MSGTNNNKSVRKRKLATILDPAFVAALSAPNVDSSSSSNANDAAAAPMLQLTNGAVRALHDCQESFVHELTREIKAFLRNNNNNSNIESEEKQILTINPNHVEAAMRAMGLDNVLQEALQYLDKKKKKGQKQNDQEEENADKNGNGEANIKKKPKGRKKPSKSKGVFSAELEAEQERLLQASIQKGGKIP